MQIMVDFAGDGTGEGELSWGQQENWVRVVRERNWLPLGGPFRLPAGTTVDDVADQLRYIMSRYQSLRTKLRVDADGRAVQVVHGSGEIPLEIVDAGDADPDEVAGALCDRFRRTELDFTTEWPLRMGLVRQGGRPTHMCTMISHIAADAAGIFIMMGELATRRTAPVTGMAPLDQAAWQRSPAGRRQNDAAMRYWDGVFRSIEPRRFRQRTEDGPRYWHGEFTSSVLLPAVRAIAAASGLGTSTVFLTVFAQALGQVTGINPVVVRPIVGNRFRPGLGGVVCTVAQAGVCVLDVAGVPFDEALRRVRRAVINAYKYAYFDHTDLIALRARVSAERGAHIDTACFLNDRHGVLGQRETETPQQIPDNAPPDTFRWVHGQDDAPFEPLFVEIDDLPDDAILVTLHLDTRSVSLADAEALAHGMAAIATAARPRVVAGPA
jgi:condensation domain-containing protein